MDTDLLTQFTQFGTAGLMAWMWLSERRAALGRERELSAAHERLMEQRVQVDALLTVVRENTRALAGVEAGQRAVAEAVSRLAPPGAGARDEAPTRSKLSA